MTIDMMLRLNSGAANDIAPIVATARIAPTAAIAPVAPTAPAAPLLHLHTSGWADTVTSNVPVDIFARVNTTTNSVNSFASNTSHNVADIPETVSEKKSKHNLRTTRSSWKTYGLHLTVSKAKDIDPTATTEAIELEIKQMLD